VFLSRYRHGQVAALHELKGKTLKGIAMELPSDIGLSCIFSIHPIQKNLGHGYPSHKILFMAK
jgi:hypothetical protein